ncbi:Nardilysin [Camponotus floridanus]|uniref:Nardilysin n=1 Tax=Camponotus floridanus TaxID=104421 RepID=E2AMV2_CAMFO|nr:Nardilysin [Camponotus floridanus]
MTRGLSLLLRLIDVRCERRHVFLSAKALREHVQSPFERRPKGTRDPGVEFLIRSYSTRPSNLSPDIMPEVKLVESDDKRHQVEYLETPVKSENDTKEYSSSEDETEDEDSDEDDEEEDEDENEDEDSSDDEDSSSSTKRVKRNEKMAACGLCVGVGSFSDPPEIPGMAHFLEHMVFMGSEKYPQENDFDAFLSKRGGSTNAETDCEHTTFYFDIQEKHLLQALDRFAQFFIKPLMKKDAITREREAVESEFQSALPYDDNRKEQLFSSFARDGHPANKFIWGNLITLRDNVEDDKLYAELHKFREYHYSAHRMKLALQARLPLDTLEQYVITCFADVPSNGLPPEDFAEFKDGISFDTPAFRRMYKVKSVEDINQVKITWAMPSLLDFYKSKPHEYVSWLVGHEGKGSIISYLRKKMWGIELFSGNTESGFEHSSMYALFKVTVLLTDEGQNHLEEVLDAVFSYISLLRTEGPQERIYDESCKIRENNFRFADEEDPIEYVEDLCGSMHYYPSQDYLTGSELYFEYDPEAIKRCLNYLRPENANIMIFNGKFNAELDKTEPWFNTKYTDVEIPQEWVERWKTIKPLPDFHLPIPNTFLTSDFTLIPIPADIPKYPVKIHTDAISEIWYRPDPKFRLPECYMNFHFVSPLRLRSLENAALLDLYCNILHFLLVEEIYAAIVVGFDFNIYSSEKGIKMKFNGFNEKLPLLVLTVMKYIVDYPNLVTKELFEILKEFQLKKLYNTFIKPKKLVRDVRLHILKFVHYTHIDLYNVLCDTNFEKFRNFITSFNERLFIQCLVQGNMTQDAVIENVRQYIEIINCKPLLPSMMPQIRITQIPLGTQYCKVRNINKTDVNSVVTNHYQAGTKSVELSVLIDLLIMIMEEPLFNRLRTKEQLGYDVSCTHQDVYGILGYSITIQTQANKYTTEHVDQRIEDFLKSFNKTLKSLPEEDLDYVKEALRKEKQCADIDLDEEVVRNWNEITTWQYMFDRLEREVLAIKDIKLKDLREWTAKHTLHGSNFRKLSIHVVGNHSKENNEGDKTISIPEDNRKMQYSLEFITDQQDKKTQAYHITDIEEWKKTLYVYPVSEGINPLKESLEKESSQAD